MEQHIETQASKCSTIILSDDGRMSLKDHLEIILSTGTLLIAPSVLNYRTGSTAQNFWMKEHRTMKKHKMLITLAGLVVAVATTATVAAYTLARRWLQSPRRGIRRHSGAGVPG